MNEKPEEYGEKWRRGRGKGRKRKPSLMERRERYGRKGRDGGTEGRGRERKSTVKEEREGYGREKKRERKERRALSDGGTRGIWRKTAEKK